jgi:LacI family transcriptional regulator
MNIKTIASMAGVSVATVSKIINNYSDIGEETRLRVQKILDETGYKPSSSAKTLATKKSNIIGVIFAGKLNSDLNHPFFVSVINSFKKHIGLLGYDILLFSNEKFSTAKDDYLARCRHFQVDGCIIIAGDDIEASVHTLDQSSIPCIGVDIALSGSNSSYIMSDNRKVSAKVVEHFYLSGYREIGFLGIERSSVVTSMREKAFNETLRNFGITINPDWIIHSQEYDEESGYQAMKQFIAKESLPKAMFAVSDLLAFGAMRALKEHNLTVPEDMALIGCDDIDACSYTDPTLTTVRQDKEKIGRLAAMMLFDLINKQMESGVIMIEPEIVVRQSCGGAV